MYTTYKDYEIMFHVSTMLPYTPNNKQQVGSRKSIFNFDYAIEIIIVRFHFYNNFAHGFSRNSLDNASNFYVHSALYIKWTVVKKFCIVFSVFSRYLI